MNNNSRFNIFETVREAYTFNWREWPYLLKAGLLPMGAQIAIGVFVQFARPEASFIELNLWQLPAVMLLGWFVFIETRLLLLGERLDQLPREPAFIATRRHAMKLSILTATLFNMGTIAAAVVVAAIAEVGAASASLDLDIMGLLVMVGIVWSLRFGIIPTLAAVLYPIRPVLRQTTGMLFSLRLIGMGFFCVFPVFFFSRMLTFLLVPSAEDLSVKLTNTQEIILTIIGAVVSLVCAALLGAAFASALKQLLGSNRSGVAV